MSQHEYHAKRQRRPSGGNVGLRLGVIIALAIAVGAVMLGVWSNVPKSGQGGERNRQAGADPNQPAAAAAPVEDAATGLAVIDDLGAISAGLPLDPNDLPEPPPWPREADLPILKRYDIDWQRGARLLSDVRDNMPPAPEEKPWEDRYQFDEPALYYLVRAVAKLPREAFRPDPPEDEVSFEQLMSMPESFRGTPVTISGFVGGVAKWEVPRPELTGFTHFYKAELYARRAGNLAETYTVFVFDNPGAVAKGAKVRTRAYFYRLRKFESEDYDPVSERGQVYVYSCPILVARFLDVAEPEPAAPGSTAGDVMLVLTLVGALALAGVVLIAVRRWTARTTELPKGRPTEELSDEQIAERIEYLKRIEQERD